MNCQVMMIVMTVMTHECDTHDNNYFCSDIIKNFYKSVV